MPLVRGSERTTPRQLRRVKLLFDQNVSHKLVKLLAVEYPHSTHVRDVGLGRATDRQVWDFARQQGFTIVSKDTDFRDRSVVDGPPPKVIWLDVHNAGTAAIESLLRERLDFVKKLDGDPETSLLILSIAAAGR